MRRVRRSAVGMVLACAVWSAWCGSALASPMWLAPTDLSITGHNASVPHVALDSQGDAVAVWTRNDGSNFITQAAVRAAGGLWQAPVDLSSAGQNAFDAEVGVDAAGDAVAIWDRSNGANQIVQGAVRPAGGLWQAPVDLSVGGQDAFNPQLAVDAKGDAIAVWTRSNGTGAIVQAAVRPAATGAWQAPVDLSANGRNAANPRVALDPAGDATAVWQRDDGANSIVQSALRPAPTGLWQAPVDLSVAGKDAVDPQISLDAQGNAIAVWTRSNGTNGIVQAAFRAPGGVWQTPVDVSAPGQNANNVEMAFDGHGDALAVWQRSNGAVTIVQSALRPLATGTWQAPVDLSAGGESAATPQVALDAQGDAVADWQRGNGTNLVVQAAVRPAASGLWQAPVDLSAGGQNAGDAQVALDGQGNATAVWERSNGANSIVEAAGYDAAGPVLGGVLVPASGVVGVPVVVSVSPLDVWSPVASVTWSFGDGQGATGASVSHVYGSAGVYTVGVSSSDGLANASGTSVRIVIAPAPAAGLGAPSLSGVSQSHRRWREGARRGRVAGRRVRGAPVGTRFGFVVDQAVRVSFSFWQRGRRGRVRRGTVVLLAAPGRHGFAFQGRIGRRRLPLGAYTLLISAVSTATGQRSPTRTLHFTIVK